MAKLCMHRPASYKLIDLLAFLAGVDPGRVTRITCEVKIDEVPRFDVEIRAQDCELEEGFKKFDEQCFAEQLAKADVL